MRKPRFTLRSMLIVVVVIAVALSLDRRVEMLATRFARDVKTNPAELLERDIQSPWMGESKVDSIHFSTSLLDRLVFRRSLVVKHSNTPIDEGFIRANFETTISVRQFGAKVVDHQELLVDMSW